ncbi:hypothetical protein MXD81_31315, partial [Microbacteriaceae bacterium K1510]|nr:hypothetical protein [Microbacteriaceae bacterium K1510]
LESVISNSSIANIREQAKVTVPAAIDKLYMWLATLTVDDERWEATASLLREGGLYKVCAGDAAFIEGLAFLGVASSVCSDKSELVQFGKDQGIDVEKVCATAKVVEEKTGIITVFEGQDRIIVVL